MCAQYLANHSSSSVTGRNVLVHSSITEKSGFHVRRCVRGQNPVRFFEATNAHSICLQWRTFQFHTISRLVRVITLEYDRDNLSPIYNRKAIETILNCETQYKFDNADKSTSGGGGASGGGSSWVKTVLEVAVQLVLVVVLVVTGCGLVVMVGIRNGGGGDWGGTCSVVVVFEVAGEAVVMLLMVWGWW